MRPLALLFVSVALFGADYGVLIRNGRAVDGTGNPWFRADVAVKDGRIAAIGSLADKTAEKVIDAEGRIVSPGFIDVHTHIEGDVEKVPRADNYVRDGVTTVITGNCGGSELKVGRLVFETRQARVGYQRRVTDRTQHGPCGSHGDGKPSGHRRRNWAHAGVGR